MTPSQIAKNLEEWEEKRSVVLTSLDSNQKDLANLEETKRQILEDVGRAKANIYYLKYKAGIVSLKQYKNAVNRLSEKMKFLRVLDNEISSTLIVRKSLENSKSRM